MNAIIFIGGAANYNSILVHLKLVGYEGLQIVGRKIILHWVKS
jgi:hypothetical protein